MKFKRIGRLTNLLSAEIQRFSEPELKNLIRECQRLTNTNCSWMTYRLKDIVIEMARATLKWQKIIKDTATRQALQEKTDGDKG